ncbi:unnamed protein product [Rotaria magnacalcarata]|uniref:G-protein coupled receptors family 2 profile 2 domain-containing protein n=2 Tax=Rotaria magnacalcarata TaxID=392030 RepID=A0A814GJ13_9BILA|nr:unnamed protein product [Rotaria magnacalcarata]CAF1387147.1 unnamed protein product [Rotaria magnacalcarata]
MMMKLIYLFLFGICLVSTSSLTNIIDADDSTIRENLQQSRNRPNVPQSLTLLMDFKDDGTTSLQIIQGSEVVYLDYGLCTFGQTFDPATGRCRDITCQETHYKYNGTACIPDENKNTVNVYKRMSDIDISLGLIISSANYNENERGNFSKRLNSQMNKTCTNDWTKMFHNAIHGYLDIDYERITKIKYNLKENNGVVLGTRSKINSKSTSNILDEDNDEYLSDSHSLLSDRITERLVHGERIIVNFNFTIADRNETSNDTSTGLHVVTLLLLASEFHGILDLCEKYSMKIEKVSLISDKNKTRQEFCGDPDVMYQTQNGIIRRRERSDGEPDFVVDVPELDTTYEGGDYVYLFLISALPAPQPTSHAVTRSSSSNSASAVKFISVCNRHPRIVHRCPDSLVMRIALCEVIQYRNFSIRIKRTGRLYTNREYRYDDYRSDLYIVVCKHNAYNRTANGKKLSFFDKAPGFLSTIAIFMSICALTITLITFLLFSSLRNLPGCNTMNLIIALLLAEILFLLQSLLIMTTPSVCLLLALGIHFFFLASFFWMNVMAFDLWKTFHTGFSIYICEVRERLPYYALYAWGIPVIIVLIGILLDVKNAHLKPCYGKYFRGCNDVCFHTKNDAPLQGCWIESASMRFILFGIPIGVILLINFIFYALTVRNIRRGLKSVRTQVEHKFQRKKQVVPGEHDVKIYMRMAVLAGFGWTIGFILFALPDNQEGFQYYLVTIFKYLFILLNATPGLFLFFVYVCNCRVFSLYRTLFTKSIQFIQSKIQTLKEYLTMRSDVYFNQTKYQLSKLQHIFAKQQDLRTRI